jgi:glycosyltransferase involved in cell wall biosynthesis
MLGIIFQLRAKGWNKNILNYIEGLTMDNNPLVSIITPCYNSRQFLAQTIESVLVQTYQNWEMIIIDDCSTDDSYNITLKYAEKEIRIKVYRMEKNGGAALARNKSIELSKGDYLAFLDSDDLWFPEKLEKQLQFMIENDCDFSFTEYEHIDENNKLLGIKASVRKKLTYKIMLFHAFTGCLTVMYKQNKENKIYGPRVGNGIEDYALFLSALKKIHNAMGYSLCLAQYRVHKKSLSGSRLNKIKKIGFYFDLMMRIEKQNLLMSFFYLFTHQFIKYFFKYKKMPN